MEAYVLLTLKLFMDVEIKHKTSLLFTMSTPCFLLWFT